MTYIFFCPSHNVIPLWINTIKLKKGHDTNNRGQRLLTTEKKTTAAKIYPQF